MLHRTKVGAAQHGRKCKSGKWRGGLGNWWGMEASLRPSVIPDPVRDPLCGSATTSRWMPEQVRHDEWGRSGIPGRARDDGWGEGRRGAEAKATADPRLSDCKRAPTHHMRRIAPPH